MPEQRLDELLSRYGTTVLAIARHRGRWTDADRLPDFVGYSLAEIDWITRSERVVHLADIVMRRTTLAVTGALTARDLDADRRRRRRDARLGRIPNRAGVGDR